MRFSLQLLVVAFAALLCAVSPTDAKLRRGLAWGVNDNYGPKLAKGLISWYWHWQDGPNPKFNGKLQWVPCFWGPKYQSQWEQRKREMKGNLPQYILGVNEPEIPGQANLSPKQAAKLHMRELEPYARKGVKISSPQMVYKTEWLQQFMKECNKLGCTVDFIAIHWYGTTKDMAKLKRWVKTIHKTFNKPIWITEYGVTAASGPNMNAIKRFHMDATAWLTKVSYVKRAAWLGCFVVNNPPDSYANNKNAFYNDNGSLRDIAHWYMYSSKPVKRSAHSNRALPSSHVARRGLTHKDEDGNDIVDDDDDSEPPEHIIECDEYCQARDKAIADFEAKNGPISEEDDLDDDNDDDDN
ncbi:Glycosyl hydrolase [Kalmanozyma brasiliensis GHG001]|uniref:Asl1-like glycosyl hydrolase catalytic domain-containing protein n=1 Tax=Kalmanozyma brasiliensis (strain GHG001) TaxID=1365824 RepID=V5E915_KALBG|nr:Glycosyl hydrolase [Kalmanozyma brasiliensis GHG001]EST06841.1 Glycosyl hydrolase [Kalmanozyma brasiliensis GHG001]